MKLDRLLARHRRMGRVAARRALAAGRVRVDGAIVRDREREVDRFRTVLLDEVVVQGTEQARYLMCHKPAGWLSATSDPVHRTVLDLIDAPAREELHLVGRLDRASTGLILLTNDGRWSKAVLSAANKVPKVYLVETAEPIAQGAADAFAAGFWFPTEQAFTLPAKLEITGERNARVTLEEGRYHQIKRMFKRIGNRVTSLHRIRIGELDLPADLPEGAWRDLTPEQVQLVTRASARFPATDTCNSSTPPNPSDPGHAACPC
jgi:16S rRNA pseudouridine516 synthase